MEGRGIWEFVREERQLFPAQCPLLWADSDWSRSELATRDAANATHFWSDIGEILEQVEATFGVASQTAMPPRRCSGTQSLPPMNFRGAHKNGGNKCDESVFWSPAVP